MDGVTPIDRNAEYFVIIKISDKSGNPDSNVVALSAQLQTGLDFEAMMNVIRGRFKSQIEDIESVPTQYDNAPFTRPTTGLWIRLSIVNGESNQVDLGNVKTFRGVGLMVASIFAPIHTGDKASLALADKIATSFRSLNIFGVRFRTPSINNVGEGRQGNAREGRRGNLWQTNVVCPFQADNTVITS